MHYSKDSVIKLVASRGLTLEYRPDRPLVGALEIPVHETEPFATTEVAVRVLAELPSKDHQITLSCPWMAKPTPVSLSFTPLLNASWRLHTMLHQKYVQVCVACQCEQPVRLTVPSLSVRNGTEVDTLNPEDSTSHVSFFKNNIFSIVSIVFHVIKWNGLTVQTLRLSRLSYF